MTGTEPRPDPADPVSRLALVSFLGLFFQMLVIRWLSGECRVYGYYANLPLITAFFGLGLGCLLANRPVRLMPAFAPLALLFGFLATTSYYREFALVGWTSEQPWPKEVLYGAWAAVKWYGTFLFLLLLAGACFVPLGQELGRAFTLFRKPLNAYAVNLAGSVVGVWGFALVCWVVPSSVTWFAIALTGAVLLDRGRSRIVSGLCALVLVGIVWQADRDLIWSPYYKIRKSDVVFTDDAGKQEKVGVNVEVNNDYYQRMLDLRPDVANRFPKLREAASYYNRPYMFCRPRSVLIVGAGSGNDVAAALRHGVERIDAVDIDPKIVELGRLHHPERPYDRPEVRLIVNDARSFLKQTDRTYDLIVFGLLDSHTLVSGLGRLRLDNYVYTEESIREAASRLNPGGVVYLGFTVYRDWVFFRFESLFENVFGDKCLVGGELYDGAGLFIGGEGIQAWREVAPRMWRPPVSSRRDVHVEAPTDDWPFLYMEKRTVPKEYLVMLTALLGAFFVAGRASLRKGAAWDFQMLFLGAGFLLVEVRGIAALALAFGATWIVMAVVITLILTMALVGNVIAQRWTRPNIPLMFGLLAAAILLSWAIPSSTLLGLHPVARGLIGGALVSLPMAFSGVIFSSRLRDHPDPEGALGSNLLGAVAGGVSEYASTLTGIRALSLIALAFYAFAFLAWRKTRR